MSICDNTTVNQETTLKLQQKHVAMLAKKTSNDPKIRRSTVVPYKKSTTVPVLGTGTKKVPRYCPPMGAHIF